MSRPLLLLTNDDGYTAPGMGALRHELERFAQVVVCAPERNQSAVSHALTLEQVLRLRTVSARTFALDGTPADCIYVALNAGLRVLPRRPDMVVSGMNHGPNLGADVNYSGTVAAAREAALRGLAAMAVSTDVDAALEPAAALAARLVERMLEQSLAGAATPPLLLNVNIPQGERWPLRVTRQGGRPYEEELVTRTDPRGREYLWIGSGQLRPSGDGSSNSDTSAFHAGCVSITPLRTDLSSLEQDELVQQIARACGDYSPRGTASRLTTSSA